MPPKVKRRSAASTKKKTCGPNADTGARGRGRELEGKLPSLEADQSRSPSSSRQGSPTHSRSESTSSQASQASAMVKKKQKKDYKLSDEEEELMVTFLEDNEMLWNKKATTYRRRDLKASAWERQAKVMSKEVSHLQGWFKGVRDNFTRLDKLPKSGSGQQALTEREVWTLQKFQFLQRITYHRPQPVNRVSAYKYIFKTIFKRSFKNILFT